jgi:hypothetical protein
LYCFTAWVWETSKYTSHHSCGAHCRHLTIHSTFISGVHIGSATNGGSASKCLSGGTHSNTCRVLKV